ncbi:MAG: protein kinase [Planctomycetes bacterium]|nr:protein kinase [Planctomycetota bacterium]
MTSADDDLPDLGPRFELRRRLARGGQAEVFEAEDRERDQRCAVKLLAGELPEEHLERFRREVELAEALGGHPGIVAIYAAGLSPEGRPYCAMELVLGETFDDQIDEGRATLRGGVQALIDVSHALTHAHGRGVIHRDVKPANVLLDAEGRARLTDFGVSKALGNEGLTQTGQALGSPCYMAPEQVSDSKRVDARTDVYGLGACLYQLLTRYRPFERPSVMEVLRAVVEEDVIPPAERDPEADPELSALCLRALAKDPDRRPQTVEAFAGELRAWLEAHPPALPKDERYGQTLAGKYTLLERLGRGGFGAVYRARQEVDGREVAIKLLHPRWAGTPEARRRFLREVAAAQAFVHKSAVQVRDYGSEEDGTLYLTMDLAPGETLRALLRREGRLAPADVLALARQVLDALVEAQAAGIVHRDLKPENLMVAGSPSGPQVRILDFGIAKAIDEVRGGAEEGITKTGTALGTLRYMSPEQAAGDPVDGRSDLYALSTVLYECLAGRPPLEASTAQGYLWKLATAEPPPLGPLCPTAPRQLLVAIEQNLAKAREQRHPDARAFRQALSGLTLTPSATRSEGASPAPQVTASGSLVRPESKPAEGNPLDVLLGGDPRPAPPWPLFVAIPLVLLALLVALDPLGWRAAAPPPLPTGALELTLLGPAEGSVGSPLEVTGRVRGAAVLRVLLDGREVAGELLQGVPTGFRFSVEVPSGAHSLEVVAESDAGRETISRAVEGIPAPEARVTLTIVSPQEGAWVAQPEVEVRGQLVPPLPGQVQLGELSQEVGEDGAFKARVPLAEGLNQIPIRVHPSGGAPLEQRWTLTVHYDPTPPEIEFEDPPVGLTTPASRVLFRGQVRNATSLWIDGEAVALKRGAFDTSRPLALGDNVFELRLADDTGGELRLSRVVKRIPDIEEPPPWTPEGMTQRGGSFFNAKDGYELVYVPPTGFDMGRNHTADQAPRRRVRLPRPLFVGKYEVTWGQYRAFCAATGRAEPSPRITLDSARSFEPSPQHPVYNVSHEDARAYAAWAGLRLLTEAEWEAVAGGVRNYVYPWGPELPDPGVVVANTAPTGAGWAVVHDDGYPFPTPVGSFPAGASLPYGLYDMAGNVHEWVADRYAEGYDPKDLNDPQGPQTGGLRVFRGGSWQDPLRECDLHTRRAAEPTFKHDHLGFRLCVSGR